MTQEEVEEIMINREDTFTKNKAFNEIFGNTILPLKTELGKL